MILLLLFFMLLRVDVNNTGGSYNYVPSVQPAPTPSDSSQDPPFQDNTNPDGSEMGPLYLSPAAEQWIDQNVIEPGYVVDWGSRRIIDPNDGSVKGSVPPTVPK